MFMDTTFLIILLLLIMEQIGAFVSLHVGMKMPRRSQLQSTDNDVVDNPRHSAGTCVVLASGVIGAKPKEVYFNNDHFLVMFPVSCNNHGTASC